MWAVTFRSPSHFIQYAALLITTVALITNTLFWLRTNSGTDYLELSLHRLPASAKGYELWIQTTRAGEVLLYTERVPGDTTGAWPFPLPLVSVKTYQVSIANGPGGLHIDSLF